jgi:hypothetical protein
MSAAPPYYAPRRGRYLSVAAIDGDAETAADLGEAELRLRCLFSLRKTDFSRVCILQSRPVH